jgi:predicted nicotinamide N-methyase
MPSNPQLDAPQTLVGLFPPDSDDDDDQQVDEIQNEHSLCFEVQQIILAGETLQIRQYDFHSHNANRVWPGTFNLAEYLLAKDEHDDTFLHQRGKILELGTATGLLAIRLALSSVNHNPYNNRTGEDTLQSCCCSTIVTSDVDDEYGDVETNLQFNYELNGISRPPIHIPHTWGTGWQASVEKFLSKKHNTQENVPSLVQFDTIVASDILLYVSAYSSLVQTLSEIMKINQHSKLILSWNRRMKESSEFFERMKDAGFSFRHEGKCIFVFELSEKGASAVSSKD